MSPTHSSLPFNKPVSLKQLDTGKPQYVTSQLLAQQVAYLFSDKIFTYSPDTFNLDVALQQWNSEDQQNTFGFVPSVQAMQTRLGAGSAALGYIFSSDFDMNKRHVPQSIIASSGSLLALRGMLDELSLLHQLTNPFTAHVAAVEYVASQGLVADYLKPMQIADELGLGLVASISAQDAQHMALYATALGSVLPTLHVYDGISGQDTVEAKGILGKSNLNKAYGYLLDVIEKNNLAKADYEQKAIVTLQGLNKVLKTKYEPFEYTGHAQAERVFVTFGSREAAITKQIVANLSKNGAKVGVVNVRVYRPFIEDKFLETLPKSTQSIEVLGQVDDEVLVQDSDFHSTLYQDVLAASFTSDLTVNDLKYPKHQAWGDAEYVKLVEVISGSPDHELTPNEGVLQASIWTLDNSPVGKTDTDIFTYLTKFKGGRVHIRNTHDNLVQGGVSRTDIAIGFGKADEITGPFAANIAYVGSEKILSEVDVLQSVRAGGTVILSLAGVKDEDLEKKLPEVVRNTIRSKNLRLIVLDSADAAISGDANIETSIVHETIQDILVSSHKSTADAELRGGLRLVAVAEDWEIVSEDTKKISLRSALKQTSFAPYEQVADDTSSLLEDWIKAAQGIVFKEVYDTKVSLHPEAGVKTSVVTVKEHRRLTPMSYERNVFHIEFDLGDSGLTYAIGEALGIHAENDPTEIQEFIKWYGLNPDEIVQVPSKEDHSILENRTVYQALIQSVDIFGRPPKRFYEALADYATNEDDQKNLLTLSTPMGATEFKRRAEVDTITFADILAEFPSAHPEFQDLIRIVSPLKRREYSIASSQHVTPTSVALLIVTVNWNDPKGRDRFGLATRFLNNLRVGTPVTVSVKPSVMKLPTSTTAPILMAGLGTGLAPFRAFVQERAYQKQVLKQPIGAVLLYLGSRHQREEYLYGEEWEAYQAAGIITLIGKAFSRDQPQKIYIQDRMRESLEEIRQSYLRDDGSFYLCGPTWPVPDVTEVLEQAVVEESKSKGVKKVDSRREIETLKEAGRFVLEVY
ncbi:hypothetical protein BT63DRAFT_238018 [Microthyrium microscopicum]|uniref:assimilatory sulfite reductase (NADPH) n=1 Tax=Microthyrium microscopicum TaxID=703497 RepID=A0A6A6UHT0_9PEZI|nr:hypothetical protein BT63DRAFT_238018 [Microthyrium microscopicum]